jgi:hypothetical protein
MLSLNKLINNMINHHTTLVKSIMVTLVGMRDIQGNRHKELNFINVLSLIITVSIITNGVFISGFQNLLVSSWSPQVISIQSDIIVQSFIMQSNYYELQTNDIMLGGSDILQAGVIQQGVGANIGVTNYGDPIIVWANAIGNNNGTFVSIMEGQTYTLQTTHLCVGNVCKNLGEVQNGTCLPFIHALNNTHAYNTVYSSLPTGIFITRNESMQIYTLNATSNIYECVAKNFMYQYDYGTGIGLYIILVLCIVMIMGIIYIYVTQFRKRQGILMTYTNGVLKDAFINNILSNREVCGAPPCIVNNDIDTVDILEGNKGKHVHITLVNPETLATKICDRILLFGVEKSGLNQEKIDK